MCASCAVWLSGLQRVADGGVGDVHGVDFIQGDGFRTVGIGQAVFRGEQQDRLQNLFQQHIINIIISQNLATAVQLRARGT